MSSLDTQIQKIKDGSINYYRGVEIYREYPNFFSFLSKQSYNESVIQISYWIYESIEICLNNRWFTLLRKYKFHKNGINEIANEIEWNQNDRTMCQS